MNSEELEKSLRTEFEDFLKQISADTQREISGLQEKVEAEFERQKTQFAEMFRDFSASAAAGEKQLDAGFRDSILEHLRQARDEGARITAIAMSEAEDMAKETAAAEAEAAAVAAAAILPPPPSAGVAELRDAIKDISNQNSQAAILKSLVSHAGQFTARGAFFIVKNENFVGWRTFGSEQESGNDAVRDIFFPVSDATTLGESVASLDTVEGAYGNYDGDDAFLEKLEFGKPDKMLAIPLVARGRGVAVLYADGGEEAVTGESTADGAKFNVEALEMLVRVAGLTVELLAAATAPSAARTADAVADDAARSDESEAVRSDEAVAEKTEFAEQTDSAAFQPQLPEVEAQTDDVQSLDEERFDDSQMPVYTDTPARDVEIFGKETQAKPSVISSEEEVEEEIPATVADEFQQPAENYDYSIGEDSQNAPVETSFDDFAFDGDEREKTPPVSVEDEFEPIYQDGQTDSAESYSWNKPSENGAQAAETLEAKDEFPTSTDATVLGDEFSFENERAFETPQNEFAETPASFETIESLEDAPQFQSAEFDTSIPDFLSDETEGLGLFEKPSAEDFAFKPIEKTVEPAAVTTTGASPAAKSTRSRFSDRNVDLPIEVTEDERRLHNDARRFARLLVSEIKLYNEQKVKEGRDANDLYERLREAVDRSREMYDKRVQPPVAAKFDYFHYELVSSLAEGDESKLGATYAGATV